MRSPFFPSTSRRRFLGFSLLTGFLAPARGVGAAVIGRPPARREPLASLPAFVDTLLPATDDSPSATALGVHTRLPGALRTERRKRLLARGCIWLDREAMRRHGMVFANLHQDARDAIVAAAEGARRRTLARVFFEVIRSESFALYYADARSWPALGYDGPPQPAGFPDHASPPSPRDGARP